MQLSSIVQVLLRLSSINWFVSGIFQLVYSLASTRSQAFSVGHVLAPMVLIISAIICWLFAPFLARIVSKGSDTSIFTVFNGFCLPWTLVRTCQFRSSLQLATFLYFLSKRNERFRTWFLLQTFTSRINLSRGSNSSCQLSNLGSQANKRL